MSAADIPTLVKHMALAIYEDGYGDGSKDQKIWHCLDAARWRLVEYGFLRSGSQHGQVSNIVLTAKGRVRDRQHKNESAFARKELKFNKLYDLIDTEADNPVTDREETDSGVATPVTEDRQAVYREKMKARRADHDATTPSPQPKRKSNTIKKARTRRVRRKW